MFSPCLLIRSDMRRLSLDPLTRLCLLRLHIKKITKTTAMTIKLKPNPKPNSICQLVCSDGRIGVEVVTLTSGRGVDRFPLGPIVAIDVVAGRAGVAGVAGVAGGNGLHVCAVL